MTPTCSAPPVLATDAPPMPRHTESLAVERYTPSQAAQWAQFLDASDNGTLFHDLRFLDYHPAGTFDTHHLIFRAAEHIVALLPAALVREPDGRQRLKSPYGASVGGFVLPPRQHIAQTMALVTALQEYAAALGCAGIEMRLAPNLYCRSPGDNLSFALTTTGFTLARRWLSHVITLPANAADVLDNVPTRCRRRYTRCAATQGVTLVPAAADRLPEFYPILERNRAKHGARPTHSLADLQRLYELVPERLGLFLCELNGQSIGGALLLELNPRVVYWSYLCHDEQYEEYRPPTLTTVRVLEHYAARGFRYLDFGPSTFDDFSLNHGLAKFKEEMGGVGLCRDTWRWEVQQ
jgi:hypothetical protein